MKVIAPFPSLVLVWFIFCNIMYGAFCARTSILQRWSAPSDSYGIPCKILAKSRIYQDEVDDPNNNDEKATDDERNTSALQWLITNRMKLVLMNDLGYTESEIDEMEPQVGP